ncbi:MAG TPA: hypothetical protein VKV28_13460 [Candidatus Binataceae bacterium]|nr:hypothetical protein [Candidatus Binataceae bacterium]
MAARSLIVAGASLAMMLAAQLALAQSGSNGIYGGYVGSDQWMQNQNDMARDRVRMDALQRGGASGGCNQLPQGWARVDATVHFPASYGGYAGWVNTAELLPVGRDLKAFLASHSVTGAFVRPALRASASTVTTRVCAPAGQRFWLIVDSGMARVAVGQLAMGSAGASDTVSLTAPPLSKSNDSQARSAPSIRVAPIATSPFQKPAVDNSWKAPTVDDSWKPPTVGSGFVPPGSR